MSTRIHWAGEDGAQHRGALSPREFAGKYKQSPDLFCKRCAGVAEKMAAHRSRDSEARRDGVTFASDEIEHLRALAEYVGRTYVGPEARKGLEILKGKLS